MITRCQSTGDAYRIPGLSDCLYCILVVLFFLEKYKDFICSIFRYPFKRWQSGAGLPISYATGAILTALAS